MAGADVDVGTELRLGLPGGGAEAAKAGKRGFEDTVDLKLKLPTAGMDEATGKPEPTAEKAKRSAEAAVTDPEKPPASKAQAVGWPPVRSYRRNIMTVQSVKNKKEDEADKQQPAATVGGNSSAFVKVSMDGAPYLRKVDLKMYNSYKDLSIALQKMFSTFTTTGKLLSSRISSWSWSKCTTTQRELIPPGSKALPVFSRYQESRKQHINNPHELINPAHPITELLQVFNKNLPVNIICEYDIWSL